MDYRGRRATIMGELRAYLDSLKKGERLDNFSLVVLSPATEIAMGIFRIGERVRNYSSLDSIVLETTVGESVTISEGP